jgi:hypothetical protein
MKAILVRVGADQSGNGGWFNGPVDSRTDCFAYVPIPETLRFNPRMATPYEALTAPLTRFGWKVPPHLSKAKMHLDPDFDHLTYGDQGGTGKRGSQIMGKLGPGDLLVFYAGLRDVHQAPRLVYALIGLYVIDSIVLATSVSRSRWHENAHTRRVLSKNASDVVVRARRQGSGRLDHCIKIGSYRKPSGQPHKRPSYRVEPSVLKEWGGLSVADGFLQRSAQLPEFNDAERFYKWFLAKNRRLRAANN